MNPLATLRDRFAGALSQVAGESTDSRRISKLVEMVLPGKDPKLGDYQANCAMPLGKQLGRAPRDVAAEIVDAVDVADLCHPPEVAGPGFINLKLRDDWLLAALADASSDADRVGVAPAGSPRTVVIDFSSPNVAKPMHVGHIRSTVIGAALCRVLGFLGHRVISDNHIGDWGTQFGMIIYGYKHFADEQAIARAPVAELSRLYKLVNQIGDYQQLTAELLPTQQEKLAATRQRIELLSGQRTGDADQDKRVGKELKKAEKEAKNLGLQVELLAAKAASVEDNETLRKLVEDHPDIAASALAETAKLHAGDAENRALWDRFLPACLEEINATYDRLGVRFDNTLGESFYQPMLAGVVEDLIAKGLATESNGAMCVMPETMGLDGNEAPFIVRKKDGAFLYATTDLATIQYRLKEWKPDAILYVVDHRQSLHFEQLFATAEKWGYGVEGNQEVELTHIAFGTVLGEDGKPYKTRSGSAVGLVGLLDEAVDRARAIADNSPMLTSDDERQEVAERIGIGAIKYADLSHNRTSDYVFDYDKMLAMNGNTAAYMQNSYARVRSIFGKAGVDPPSLRASGAAITIDAPAERALGLAVLQFAEALDRVAADYRPNHLAAYLFDLASRYSEFYEQCHVLKAETEALKESRLLLCDLTARVIGKGLDLLGIETVERM